MLLILLERIEYQIDVAFVKVEFPIFAVALHLRLPPHSVQLKPARPSNLPEAAAKTLRALQLGALKCISLALAAAGAI